MEILFDETGVIPEQSEFSDIPIVGAIASAFSKTEKFSLKEQIQKFSTIVYAFNGDEHSPRLLLITWGELSFPCVLTTVSYRYTHFKPDGTPIRAYADCTFTEQYPDSTRVRQENRLSPDLTRLLEVREGDTLPLLVQRTYKNPELYLEVARINNLVNFRRLRAGDKLIFPPIAKGAKS